MAGFAVPVLGFASLGSLQAAVEQLNEWKWRFAVKGKLETVVQAVNKQFRQNDICTIQAWMKAPESHGPDQIKLYTDPNCGFAGTEDYYDFRSQSCRCVQDCFFGMPGRVWQSGSVQVVQNISIIPPSIHPRCNMRDQQLQNAAECVYIPVYDLTHPHDGPAAVFECILSSSASDSMLVANLISYIGTVLCTMKLSLSSPIPQPIARSAVAGKRARALASSQDDLQSASSREEEEHQHQQDGHGMHHHHNPHQQEQLAQHQAPSTSAASDPMGSHAPAAAVHIAPATRLLSSESTGEACGYAAMLAPPSSSTPAAAGPPSAASSPKLAALLASATPAAALAPPHSPTGATLMRMLASSAATSNSTAAPSHTAAMLPPAAAAAAAASTSGASSPEALHATAAAARQVGSSAGGLHVQRPPLKRLRRAVSLSRAQSMHCLAALDVAHSEH